jgi:short-subunit dehydrogenase
MDFSGKTILLTGASSGIGKAILVELSKYDCTVIILARRLDILLALKNESRNNPARIYAFQCDVSDKINVITVFGEILKQFPRIDVAILDAGVAFRNPIEEFDITIAEKTINTNVLGLIYCVSQLLPMFMEQKSGVLVGVSSLADERGFPKSGLYNASKAAATKFLEGIRIELMSYGVKVLTVKPGFVETPMTAKNEFKMPLVWSPEKAAKFICENIKKEKRIIAFPFLMHMGILLLRIMPPKLFDMLAGGHYKETSK